MRTHHVLLVACVAFAAAGFRCPGPDPSVREARVTPATGGRGGAGSTDVGQGGVIAPDTVSTSGVGANGGGGSGGNAMPLDCALRCADCAHPLVCQALCEQAPCSADTRAGCFQSCGLVDTASCLSDAQCLPENTLCKVLCANVLENCVDPGSPVATHELCVARCGADLDLCASEMIDASALTVLDCMVPALGAGSCDETIADGCPPLSCNLDSCILTWVTPFGTQAVCPAVM